MRTPQILPVRALIAAVLLGSFCAVNLAAQVNSAAPQITQAVNSANLVVLRGNVHPLARAAYDRGPAPASLSMQHMLLVLKRSPQQEAALEELLAEQQDKSSSNYHKWLTPAEFGAQFGPSDSDIQTVESWLRSQGFTVNSVSAGRVVIDFSGTASTVQGAFHTAMHSYVLPNGRQHWANSTDPEIPAALASVVAGVRSLNNFFPKPQHVAEHRTGVRPAFTYPPGCTANFSAADNCFFDITPADFDTIYNVPLTATGAGQTVAIVSDTDVSPADLQQFRSMFSLTAMSAPIGPTSTPNTSGCPTPASPTGAPCFVQFVPTGSSDPGVQCPESGESYDPASCTSTTNGDEAEAALDVEWAGVPAPGANIWLVSSADTSTAFGGDLSATYVVNCPTTGPNCPVAVPASVLSSSYGACELALGTSGNTFYNQTWQQATAEGLTILSSTGDSGSAGCDAFDPSQGLPQPAEEGLAVNGVGSTPYDTAVGGTDFDQISDPGQFWNATNSGTGESAKGYIPETTWNGSCTNTLIFGSSAITDCNNGNLDGQNDDNFIYTEGGSGGMSSCTSSSATATTIATAVASCANPYPKPSWQQGSGVPADGVRDVPDVSLFASNGTIGTAYIVCEADTPPATGQPGQAGEACSLSTPPSSTSSQASFEEFGGTSVSVQIFGGIVALMDQAAAGNKQGNINPLLYSLANKSGNTCTSEANPPSTCVFYDVQSGTITQPCDYSLHFVSNSPSPNCTTSGSNSVGILEISGTDAYNAGAGYDLATGLGSVNVGNLIGQWPTTGSFILSSVDPSVTIPSASGSGTITFTITSENGFSGTIDFSSSSCSGLPSGFTCMFPASFTLQQGQTITETVSIQSSSSPALAAPGSHAFWNGNVRNIGIPLECALALAALAFAFSKRARFRRAALAFLFVGLGVAAGCGGGGNSSGSSGNNSGGTGTGVTTATMTVVSGSISQSINFQVTVK